MIGCNLHRNDPGQDLKPYSTHLTLVLVTVCHAEIAIFFVFCICSKNVSVERQSSEGSKRGGTEQQHRCHVDQEHDRDVSSHDSDHDRLSTCDRQMVSSNLMLACKSGM